MDIHLINRHLRDDYGIDWLGQPYFRVVWSDDQLEKRLSDFEDYLPGTNVLIRRVREVRECKKYSFLPPQYILEKLFFNQHNKEILDNDTMNPSKCTYEPLWCFGYDGKKVRRPVWRAIQLLIQWHTNPQKPLSPSDLKDIEIKKMEEDEKVMLELLNTHIKNDAFHSSVQDGDTILMNDAYRGKNGPEMA